jgi:AraC family transcriptional regulator, regulatory protein of adaptative response / methylated-DNA-[protein]-cysteine methyltransferase
MSSSPTKDTIQYGSGQSDLGRFVIAVQNQKLLALLFVDEAQPPDLLLRQRFGRQPLIASDRILDSHLQQIAAAIDARRGSLPFVLAPQGTLFQQTVWAALRAIPLGQTVSYSDIAKQIQRPLACRAVAQACAANPIAFFIPCHRVVRTDGHLGGYRWGMERKVALLTSESNLAKRQS